MTAFQQQRAVAVPAAFEEPAPPAAPPTLAATAMSWRDSSNIKAVDYDEAAQQLTVTFMARDGSPTGTYRYDRFSPTAYGALCTADSPGGFLRQAIKGLPVTKLPSPIEA
jgi:KTSC domain